MRLHPKLQAQNPLTRPLCHSTVHPQVCHNLSTTATKRLCSCLLTSSDVELCSSKTTAEDGFLPPIWLGRVPLLVLGMVVMGRSDGTLQFEGLGPGKGEPGRTQQSVFNPKPQMCWDVPPLILTVLNRDYSRRVLESRLRTLSRRGNIPTNLVLGHPGAQRARVFPPGRWVPAERPFSREGTFCIAGFRV